MKVVDTHKDPILFSYQADGTDTRVSKYYCGHVGDRRTRREGEETLKLHMERGWLHWVKREYGTIDQVPLIKEPQALTKNKSMAPVVCIEDMFPSFAEASPRPLECSSCGRIRC